MTYQELLEITNNISFDKVFEAEYTTGNGWTNALWSTQASFIQFLNNFWVAMWRSDSVRKLVCQHMPITAFPSRMEK